MAVSKGSFLMPTSHVLQPPSLTMSDGPVHLRAKVQEQGHRHPLHYDPDIAVMHEQHSNCIGYMLHLYAMCLHPAMIEPHSHIHF